MCPLDIGRLQLPHVDRGQNQLQSGRHVPCLPSQIIDHESPLTFSAEVPHSPGIGVRPRSECRATSVTHGLRPSTSGQQVLAVQRGASWNCRSLTLPAPEGLAAVSVLAEDLGEGVHGAGLKFVPVGVVTVSGGTDVGVTEQVLHLLHRNIVSQ